MSLALFAIVFKMDPNKRKWPGCLALVWIGRYALYLSFHVFWCLGVKYDHLTLQKTNGFVIYMTWTLNYFGGYGFDQLMVLFAFYLRIVKNVDLEKPWVKYSMWLLNLVPFMFTGFYGIGDKWLGRHAYILASLDFSERSTEEKGWAAFGTFAIWSMLILSVYVVWGFINFWRRSTEDTMIKTETTGSLMREKATLKLVAEGFLLVIQLIVRAINQFFYVLTITKRNESATTDWIPYALRESDIYNIRFEILTFIPMLYCYFDLVIAFFDRYVFVYLDRLKKTGGVWVEEKLEKCLGVVFGGSGGVGVGGARVHPANVDSAAGATTTTSSSSKTAKTSS